MSLLQEFEIKMEKTLEHFRNDMKTIKTGRASISIFDNLKVDYYGEKTPLNQIAALSTPDASTIVIDPWEKNMIKVIEKAIQESDHHIGLNPSNDGVLIRIHIPALTEERRKEIVKIAKKKVEEIKVAIRNIRRDMNEFIKKQEKNSEISEDESKKLQDQSQKITDKFIIKIDEIYIIKEKEILEV